MKTLRDPSGMDFEWTDEDIDGVMAELGRQMLRGKFNPKTWKGEEFEYVFADGTTRKILPEYFGFVYAEWQKLQSAQT